MDGKTGRGRSIFLSKLDTQALPAADITIVPIDECGGEVISEFLVAVLHASLHLLVFSTAYFSQGDTPKN